MTESRWRRPLGAVRARLMAEVNSAVHGQDLHLERYDRPLGDPGLFGPQSVVWRVHGHPAGMLTGGFAALLLQSLHPLAMAAVDAHSDFRTDPTGRLNRTARFVTTTTLGSTAAAEQAIESVRRIHPRIHGTAPDGRPYRADDPELLTWVHTAEVRCFLAGYQTYSATPLTAAECDSYYAQVALIAERLGAVEVPRSRAEVERYLDRLRPELRATPAALDCARFLRGFGRSARERAVVRVLTNGSVDLLPDWARAELGIRRPGPVRAGWDRPLARGCGRLLVWACGPSEIRRAAHARAAGRQ
ncbi:oxygenase MpaB family protein [Kitasatospora azatica]|uniref:oxygenase MpaB family protein n=1 Tax=Kitasatospora azatica TaxID=58347 RepID=UPI00068B9D9A|nr:oxygenase MpaB family protein [Kitasatospora azatica]